MGQGVFEVFHEAIIDALGRGQEKTKTHRKIEIKSGIESRIHRYKTGS